MKKTHLFFAAIMLCCASSSSILASSNDEDQPQIAITHPSLTRIQDDMTRVCVFSILQPHHAKHLDGIAQGLAYIQDEDVRIQVASLLSADILTHLDNVGAQNLITTLVHMIPNAENRAHVMSLITPEIIDSYKQYLPNLVMQMARMNDQDQRATFMLLAEESLENAMHYANTGQLLSSIRGVHSLNTYGPREFGW